MILALHSNNQPIEYVDRTWMSIKCIRALWPYRANQRYRGIIKAHLALIRQWRAA